MARAVLIALCLAVAAAALLSTDTAAEPPADAPVLDCRDRITGAFTKVSGKVTPYRFRARRRHDTVIGPVAFSGARDLGRRSHYDAAVREDQWLKTVAMVRRDARATLEVPEEQRSWMRMEYAHGAPGAGHAVTLQGCRRPPTRAECGRRPWDTCARDRTPFSGGFTIDYATAPHQGRCAELLVWVEGREQPRRERIFRPGAGRCP